MGFYWNGTEQSRERANTILRECKRDLRTLRRKKHTKGCRRKKPRHGQRLLMRSRRFRRLQCLKKFEIGEVYSFVPLRELHRLPEDVLLYGDAEALWSDEQWRPREIAI